MRSKGNRNSIKIGVRQIPTAGRILPIELDFAGAKKRRVFSVKMRQKRMAANRPSGEVMEGLTGGTDSARNTANSFVDFSGGCAGPEAEAKAGFDD
jgi:hypothetical protein